MANRPKNHRDVQTIRPVKIDQRRMDRILETIKAEDLPVFDIGPVTALANEQPGYRPKNLLPGVQSMFCFGLPIPREVYRTPTHAVPSSLQNLRMCVSAS